MSTLHPFAPLEFPGSVWTDEPDPGLSWFAVVCNPRCERKAAAGLEREGLAPYLPVTVREIIRNRRKLVSVAPLFPRYLFVGLEAWQDFWKLRGIDGVESLVRFDGVPARIPPKALTGLAEAEKAGAFDKTRREARTAPFRVGQAVEVRGGAFSALAGSVARSEPDRRVEVLLQFMGRATRVSIDACDLRAM